METGERTVVGVNAFQDGDTSTQIRQPDYPALEAHQKISLDTLKTKRDSGAVAAALEEIRACARSGENLLPPMIHAVKELATLGEISEALREVWGTYDEG